MTHKAALGSGLAIVAIVAALFFVSKPHTAAPAPQQSTTTTTVAVTSGAGPSYDTAPAPLPLKPGAATVVAGSASTTQTTQAPAAPKEFITLIVGTSTYRTPVTASHLVIDSMRALADADPSFTFDGQQYSGLGFFVDSINGKKSGNGYNWMLYVNGKQADLGASQATIAAGDTAEWKYEK